MPGEGDFRTSVSFAVEQLVPEKNGADYRAFRTATEAPCFQRLASSISLITSEPIHPARPSYQSIALPSAIHLHRLSSAGLREKPLESGADVPSHTLAGC